MANNQTRHRQLTDKQLLESAWSELKGKPRVFAPGKPSSIRTGTFSARYRGLCHRCGKWIELGNDVRFHQDFSGAVHSGCRPPAVSVTKVVEKVVVTNARQPELCSTCHQEHAGECL
jgi:hypothetical protein